MTSRVALSCLLLALAACRSAATPKAPDEAPLDDLGWTRALESADRLWRNRPYSSTLIAIGLDADVGWQLRASNARVLLDGAPLELDDDKRMVVTEIEPGAHTLAVDARVVAVGCGYCGFGSATTPRRNLELVVAPLDAVVVRLAVRSREAPPTTPVEDRIYVVAEVRAWHRVPVDPATLTLGRVEACVSLATQRVVRDRENKDIVALQCHLQRLSTCRALRELAVQHGESLARAEAAKDAKEIAHQRALLDVIGDRATTTTQETLECIGE